MSHTVEQNSSNKNQVFQVTKQVPEADSNTAEILVLTYQELQVATLTKLRTLAKKDTTCMTT